MNQELSKELSNHKKGIEKELKKLFSELKKNIGYSKLLRKNYSILETFVLNGGKRLRPLLMILAYKACNGEKQILRECLSVELFHNSTLIEDDFMDEDETRRNKNTVCKELQDNYLKRFKELRYKGVFFDRESSKFAVSESTILGNILYSVGEKCLADSKFEPEKIKKAINIFQEVFIQVNDGQLLDLEFELEESISEKDYLKMAEKKSAWLVKASLEIGAVLAGASDKQLKALSDFAINVTVAFQVYDDLMDINPNLNKGRFLGSDIAQGKKTLVYIKALELTSGRQKRFLKKVISGDFNDKKLAKAIDILNSCGAVDYCIEFCKQKVSNGKKALNNSKFEKDSKKTLLLLADYFIERNI